MTIEERIERLERQNRHLSLGLAGAAVAAVAVFAGAAQRQVVPDVIKAKAFHLVTDDGKTLVKIEDSKGLGFGLAGTVTTYAGNGTKLVELGATSRGGAVTTFNGQGKDLIRLGVTTDGTGLVGVFDPSGRNRRGVLATRP